MKRILLTSTATSALLLCGTASAELSCVEAPDCRSLGYIKTASQCSGKSHTVCPYDATAYSCEDDKPSCDEMGYKDQASWCPTDNIPCPYDTSKVKCLGTNKVGDVKFSRQTDDHDGWLLCDGRGFSQTLYPELRKLLGRSYLPSYQGSYYLKPAVNKTQSQMNSGYGATLPNITGTISGMITYPGQMTTRSGAFKKTIIPSITKNATESKTNGWWNDTSSIVFDASSSSSIYGAKDERGVTGSVNPPHFLINTFIYAGKVGEECPGCYDDYYYYSPGDLPFVDCQEETRNYAGVNMTVTDCGPIDYILGCSLYFAFEKGQGMEVYDFSSGEYIYGPGSAISDVCYRYPQCVMYYTTMDDVGNVLNEYCRDNSAYMIYSCTVDPDCLSYYGNPSF